MTFLILLLTFISLFFTSVGVFNIIREGIKQTKANRPQYSDELSFPFKITRPLARWLMPHNRKLNLKGYEARIGQQLVMAGKPGNLTPLEFIGFKEIFLVFFTILGLLLYRLMENQTALLQYFCLFGLPLFGWIFPGLDLRGMIQRRQLNIIRALPFDLDLLTLSVEAGLDFASALQKVVEKGKDSALKEEWSLTLKEIRMGKTRREALRSLADRCQIPDVTSLVTSLILADQMGAGIGHVLRIQSEQLRQKRSQRAEELAQKAPVKLLFPLIAFIFPAVFVILFAPVIIEWFVIGI